MRGRPPPPGRRRPADGEEEKNRIDLDRERKSQEVESSATCSREAVELMKSSRGQVEVEVCLLNVGKRRIQMTAIEDDASKLIGSFTKGSQETLNVIVPLADDGEKVFSLIFQVYQDKTFLGDLLMTREEILLPRLGQFQKCLSDESYSLDIRLHLYARVVVSVCEATQLRSADIGGASDPYAVCMWNGHKSRRLGRTQTIAKCLNPEWNFPVIVLVPLLRPFHGGHMSIDVFDDDWMMGRDDFLGRAVLDGDFILRHRTPETNRVTLPLKGRHPRERAQGSIDLRIFVHEDLSALCRRLIDDVRQKTRTLNDVPRVHAVLTVLGANGLRRADCCGLFKGDPYAVVSRDGIRVGRTPTVSKSLDPVWDRKNTFKLLNLPTQLSTSSKQPKTTSPSGEVDDEEFTHLPHSNEDEENDTGGKRQSKTESPSSIADEENASMRVSRDEAALRGEPFVDVRIDIYDDDTISRDFLGTVAVTWRQLMSPGDHELVLADHPNTKRRRRRRRVRGTVTIRVQLEAVVSVVINEGVGLAQHDPYDKSDPYAVAKWGSVDGTVVAKTQVRDNNLDPKWYGPSFELAVPIVPRDVDELRIEVWEKDTWSSDDFMGLVCVSADDLLRPSPGIPRFLTRRPGKAADPFPQGYLELDIHASFVPFGILEPKPAEKIKFRKKGVMRTLDAEPQVEMRLCILRAGGLLRQDLLGGADPFVQLRLDGKLVGKTKTQHNTLKPVWKSQDAFHFCIPINADGDVAARSMEARIEVWNSAGMLGRHQLMGVTRIGARQLMMQYGVTRYALTPENPSAQFLKDPDSVYPGLGWIEISVKVSAEITFEVVKAEGLRAADKSGTSDPYAVIRWDGPDARKVGRCAAAKRTLSPEWFFSVPLSVPLTQPESIFASIVIEVWDHDSFASHDFLGLCVVDSYELMAMTSEIQTTTTRLLNRDKRKEAEGDVTYKVEVAQSVVRLRQRLMESTRKEKTANVLDGAHVKFEILRATRLSNKDGRFGISDPYVKAYANEQKIGSTSIVYNSLNPEWPGDGSETFTLKNFPTFGDTSKNENFMVRLSIYDSDTLGRDDFMGEAALTWDLLMKAGTHSLPVKGRIFDPKRAGEKAVAFKKKMEAYYAKRVGRRDNSPATRKVETEKAKRKCRRHHRNSITRETPTLVVRVWHIARVRLHLTSAHQLRAADVGILTAGKSDPYATVRYRGKTVAKTKVQKGTLDPRWHACFEVEVPTFEPMEGAEADALIEIFDQDIVGSNDFLGCVVLTQDMMLRPHYGDIFELGPRPNAKTGEIAPTGFLDLKIESSFIPSTLERIDWPRDMLQPDCMDINEEVDALVAYNETWGKRNILFAKDEKTGKRYWYEAAQDGSCQRWWDDPRPLPPRPLTTFRVPAAGPKPSPTKRKYAKVNEPKHGEPGYEFRPVAVVEVNAIRAGGLKNTDRFGLSDPYVSIRYGSSHAVQTVGKTRVVNNSLDPVWSDTPFRFAVPLDSECVETSLLVELWDSDSKYLSISAGRDDALGMCKIEPFDYLNAVSPIRRSLRPQPGEDAVTGWVEVRTSVLGRIKITVEDVQFATGTLEDGEALKKRLVFEPILKGWCETKLESVRLFQNEEHESKLSSFDVDIALQRAGIAVEIQVFEERTGRRFIGKQRSLGVATVSGEDLIGQDIVKAAVVASNTEESVIAFIRLKVDCPDAVKTLARACWAAREMQKTCNVLPHVAAIETSILRATNLKKADTFSLSDPFVKGWSNGSLVGQTVVKSNTLNPSWDGDKSATFRIENVRTLSDDSTVGRREKSALDDAALLLEVWDSNGGGRRGTFLGHCVLRQEDLMSAGEKELILVDRDMLIEESSVAHHGTGLTRQRSCIRRVCGVCCGPCICLGCALAFPIAKLCGATIHALRKMARYCSRRKPIQGKLIVRVQHQAQVRLRILEAYGLPWADTTLTGGKQKSDPYCIIEYGGKKIAKTRVRANTNDPCFYEEVGISIDVPVSTIATDSSESSRLQNLPWNHPGRAFQPAGNDALLISVFDHDMLSADDLLGQIVIRPQFLLAPQNGTHWQLTLEGIPRGFIEIRAQSSRIPGSLDPVLRRQHGVLGTYREAVDKRTGRRYYFDIWSSECFWINPVEAAEQSGVKIDDRGRPVIFSAIEPCRRKKKSTSVAASKPEERFTLDPNEAQVVLSILVARATNLAAADGTGFTDPYAVVKLGEMRIGNTSVNSRSLNPEWQEIVPVVLPLGASADVTIEVYDHDTFGNDDFLGAASFNSKLVMDKTEEVLTLPLRGRAGGKPAQGEVTLHLTVALKVIVEILCAEKETVNERGWYCVTSWHGREERELTRTATVYDKLSRWNEHIAVAVPLHFQKMDRLRLEVKEHNTFGRDTTIGKIELDASTLLADFPANEYTGDKPVLRYALCREDEFCLSVPSKRGRDIFQVPTTSKDDAMTLLIGDGRSNGATAVAGEKSLAAKTEKKNSSLLARWRGKSAPNGSQMKNHYQVTTPSPTQEERMIVHKSCEAAEDSDARDPKVFLSIRIQASQATLAYFSSALTASRQRPSSNVLPRTFVEIEILKGDSLRRADYFGKSDPFVELIVGSDRFRTKTIKSTLNPKWNDERFIIPALQGHCVELRVYDEDTLSKPDILGYSSLDYSSLTSDDSWQTRHLEVDPNSQPTEIERNLGTITFRTRLVVEVRILLVGVFDLALSDSMMDRVPDAYASVTFLDRSWGTQTTVRSSTCRPLWYHTVELQVPVPADGVYGDPALVTVYDKNTLSQDTVVGIATFPHESLVFPHDHPGTLPILDPKSSVVKGWLEVQIETSHVPGRIEPRRRPEESPVFAKALDPRTDKPYWYDVCTGEQYSEDPRPAKEALLETLAGERRARENERALALPVALVRAEKGFPEPPKEVTAKGQAAAARVWWIPPEQNGPPIVGYVVERQRRVDKKNREAEWRSTGSVYVSASTQSATATGDALIKEESSSESSTSVLIDQLANGAKYRFRVSSENTVGRSAMSEWSNEVRVSEPLPEGWVEIIPKTDRSYFYNAKTQQSSWTLPQRDPYFLPTDIFLKFSEDEIKHLKILFSNRDQDQSHSLTVDEFEACLPEMGETLSQPDILWLFHQADSSTEMNFVNFCRAIVELKKARIETAPVIRKIATQLKLLFESRRGPRVGRAGRALIASKEDEIKTRCGAWTRRAHPEGLKDYWVNEETGQSSYTMPAEVRFFVPDALMTEASLFLDHDSFRALEKTFAEFDEDQSGSIDAGELKLLVERVTGQKVSDARVSGLIREVDADNSGEVEFDEFVLILVTLRKKGKGGQQWAQLLEKSVSTATAGGDGSGILPPFSSSGGGEKCPDPVEDAGLLRRKSSHPHGHYCVCGCRGFSADDIRRRKRTKRSIFPQAR